VGDNHHHVVCRGCGDVADIDCVRSQKRLPDSGLRSNQM